MAKTISLKGTNSLSWTYRDDHQNAEGSAFDKSSITKALDFGDGTSSGNAKNIFRQEYALDGVSTTQVVLASLTDVFGATVQINIIKSLMLINLGTNPCRMRLEDIAITNAELFYASVTSEKPGINLPNGGVFSCSAPDGWTLKSTSKFLLDGLGGTCSVQLILAGNQ